MTNQYGLSTMKWTLLSLLILSLSLATCTRNGAPAARYDEHQCPFCTMEKGVCSYCSGKKKCSFCKGTGNRTIVVDNATNEKLKKVTYRETCAFCSGSGDCRYCAGKGTCRVCDGTGRIESWDFYGKAALRHD